MVLNIVSILYFVTAGALALLLLRQVIKARSVWEAISLAILFIPFALRALRIK